MENIGPKLNFFAVWPKKIFEGELSLAHRELGVFFVFRRYVFITIVKVYLD